MTTMKIIRAADGRGPTTPRTTPAHLDDGHDAVVVGPADAARLLGIGTSTLRAYIKAGEGPRYFRVGPARAALIKIRMGDLRAWAFSRTGESAPPRQGTPLVGVETEARPQTAKRAATADAI